MKGKIYSFKETKNQYKVTGEGLMKNPITRKWEDCVIYEQYKTYEDGELFDVKEQKLTFVREKKDFLIKFLEVK